MDSVIFKGYDVNYKIFFEPDAAIKYLRTIKKIQDVENCEECMSLSMHFQKKACSIDNGNFKCNICNKEKSVARILNPILPNIPIFKILHAAYLYSRNILDYDVYGMINISDKTYIKLKKVFINAIKTCTPTVSKLGGEGRAVQIDETACSKKKMVFNPITQQTSIRDTQWVIGIFCECTKRVVLKVLEDRCHNTLKKIIEEYVAPGSIIKTDGYPSYPLAVQQSGFIHEVVNHSIGFKNEKGTHTNNIENVWSSLKRELKKRGGVDYEKLQEFVEAFSLKLKSGERKRKEVFNQYFENLIKNI